MPAGSRIRVVLVDDHHMFREALRDLLATVENIEIVGEAQDAHTAFALVEREKPDVAVIDLALPGLDGIAAAQEIRHRSSTTRTLILSGSSRAENASRALAAGVDGFAIKAQWSEELLVAIWAVARGERYVAPQLESVLQGSAYRGTHDRVVTSVHSGWGGGVSVHGTSGGHAGVATAVHSFEVWA